MAVCDKWVAVKIVEFLMCVACLAMKRVSQDHEARLALLLQKLSREWSLLNSVTWDTVGGAFADAIYGGYTIITFGLIIARVFQEIPKGRRLLEGYFLGLGMLFFLILGGLELASLESVPKNLVVNGSILGSFSLIVAALFLIDLMAPRIYTATNHSQTDPFSSPAPQKKVSIISSPNLNGLLNGEKTNGVNSHIHKERPKDLDLENNLPDKDTKKEEITLFEQNKIPGFPFEDTLDSKDQLQKSKFGSIRNGLEAGNYVRLNEPLSIPDKFHYEQELAKFNEKYLRDYLDNFAGKLSVKEDYLPEPQTPVFAKVKAGRLKGFYDETSPGYELNRSKSPTPPKAKTVPSPTLQQLEDYLRGSSRSKRADTPALFPMEPIEEKDVIDDGRASGTPTDPGYVQYTAGRWSDKSQRDLRTPRHSPTK